MCACILLQMKLTTLPGNRWKDTHSGSFQSGVIVTGNHLYTMKTSLPKGLRKLSPMNFCFRKLYTCSKHSAMTIILNTVSYKQRTINNISVHSDFFISGIKQQIFNSFSDWTVTLSLKFFIKHFCGTADLHCTDRKSAKFFKNVPY